MNIAILSVTEKGKKLSSRLKILLDEDPTIIKVNTFHKNVKNNVNTIFDDNYNDNFCNDLDNDLNNHSYEKSNNDLNNTHYDAIIGIMATGILIRSIADKIQDKTKDPAILSMDENGKYVISLVSGHLGRANELTKKIAKLLRNEPVITTATDISDKIGIDTLATKLYWEILNKNEILAFNKAILEEIPIKLYINLCKDNKINYKDFIDNYLKNKGKNTLEIIDIKDMKMPIENIQNSIFSNDSTMDDYDYTDYNAIASFDEDLMFFKPQKVVLGIGAKAKVSKEKVKTAIRIAMNNLKLSIERIDYVATAEVKKDEKGILETLKELDKPLEIVTIDEIKKFKSQEISSSKFVQEKFDIPGVAEPTALIVAKKKSNRESTLIHRKIAIDGVTVAVAVSK